jgi:hypothetical protein
LIAVDANWLRSDSAAPIHRMYRLRTPAVMPAAAPPSPLRVARDRLAPSDASESDTLAAAADSDASR